MEHRVGRLSVVLPALRFPWARRLRAVLPILFLAAVILAPRVFNLGAFLTADEKQWAANTGNFLRNFAVGDLDHLLQLPHPGVTTQWFGAPTIFSESWAVKKLPLAVAGSLLIGAVAYVFARLWGRRSAVLLVLLLALNPVLVAHTRVYAMDALLALFVLLSLGLFLLWETSGVTRYLVASGSAGALAVLSKLPGLTLVPWVIVVLAQKARSAEGRKVVLRAGLLWAGAFLLTLPFILPSLLTDGPSTVRFILEFFSSDAYRELHRAPLFYYASTLGFSSTPLQVAAVLLLPVAWIFARRNTRVRKGQLASLLLFAVLFLVGMSIGAKKGDRYILPVFLVLDVLVVAVVSWLRTPPAPQLRRRLVSSLVVLGILWQGVVLWQLHPYALAYVNPLMKSAVGERRMGWGEGLDRAAVTLNSKPDAERMTVASYYPNEFAYRFRGRVIPVSHFEQGEVRYVVLYRAMLERGPDAWETHILEQFAAAHPEETIVLNGIPYAWIYRKDDHSSYP